MITAKSEYSKILLSYIREFMAEGMSGPDFERSYSDYLFEKVPEGALTSGEEEFFGRIAEWLDFSGEGPSEEDRQWGSMTYDECRNKIKVLFSE